ncbi:S-layer homology domain-containing protein [Paenisporosarcina macmurdoensis]|uniref:S-layer homology domain-containing protein n=1 Tax=Paenisporosarcina macmurdoensis TaxID=212659 RepID=A0ABW1L497_9BACL
MIHIRKVILLVVMFTLAFTMLLTTNTARADDISGTLELEMREAVERGILLGYGDGKFGQEDDVTRGQFAAFMERALNLPASNGSFVDVRKDSKLAPSIYAVANAGIMIGGSDNTFNPDALITRGQVALTIKNALNYSEMVIDSSRLDFTDANSMSSVTLSAVYNAIHYNIISGYPKVVNGVTTLSYKPELNATRAQAAAFIIRLLNAKESYVPPVEESQDPTPPVTPPVEPPVDETLYQLAVITNNELVKTETTYKTFDEALTVYNANLSYEAIYRGKEIMKVKPGSIAFGDNTVSSSAPNTIIYFDSKFTQQATFIERGREMRYIDSNADYIKVQVAATMGYVKHSETNLKPKKLVVSTNRDYYVVSQWGTLIHHLTNHYTNKNVSYPVGPAPSFMQQGPQYLSYDGIHFMDANGRGIGNNFPYFQYVSARTTTDYTAEEIDAYIVKILNEKYPARASESKLIGMGKHFKKLEQEKRVNALFILSLAIHESAFGLSDRALQCNNLFGLHIYDSTTKTCPKDGTFSSPEIGANTLVDNYWNSRYINPEFMGVPARNLGAAFGNKTTGFNVNYASDPTWGSKAAAHMLQLDKDLGKKDLNKFKKILFTKYEVETRVRKEPSTSSEVLYSYRPRNVGVYKDSVPPNGYPLGYPLTVVDSIVDGEYTWYKVYSDKFVDQTSPVYGWIRSDVVIGIDYP